MAYRYRVKTVCTATVAEDWTVTSDRPLTPEQLADIVVGGELDGEDVPAGISTECVEEEISDEHDRSFEESYLLDEDEEDGERTECGGCGESFNRSESDANDQDTYCSADCEADDTEED